MYHDSNVRTIVVTGSTRGIGCAIAKYFHARGDYVLFSGRNDNGVVQTLGDRARFEQADVCLLKDLRRLVEVALEWTGRLDVFINNAGESHWMQLDEVTEEFWQEMIDVNAKSVLFGSQQAARAMKSGGCILNISSLAGKRGSAKNAVYCAAKFAVNGITQSLAKELGPRGIRVNAVCPVLVRTSGLLKALSDVSSPSSGDAEVFLSSFAQANSALGALPTAEQVAEFCFMLAGASAITGQCINVDSGVFPQ